VGVEEAEEVAAEEAEEGVGKYYEGKYYKRTIGVGFIETKQNM